MGFPASTLSIPPHDGRDTWTILIIYLTFAHDTRCTPDPLEAHLPLFNATLVMIIICMEMYCFLWKLCDNNSSFSWQNSTLNNPPPSSREVCSSTLTRPLEQLKSHTSNSSANTALHSQLSLESTQRKNYGTYTQFIRGSANTQVCKFLLLPLSVRPSNKLQFSWWHKKWVSFLRLIQSSSSSLSNAKHPIYWQALFTRHVSMSLVIWLAGMLNIQDTLPDKTKSISQHGTVSNCESCRSGHRNTSDCDGNTIRTDAHPRPASDELCFTAESHPQRMLGWSRSRKRERA